MANNVTAMITRKLTMLKNSILWISLLVVALGFNPALAADSIPLTSGFRGFVLFGPGYFNVKSNLVVKGPPLLGDIGNTRINSLNSSANSQNAAAFAAVGELNYTFAGTGTQVFLGNRLEDVLRLDLAFGLGVRQDIGNGGVIAASVLTTPTELEVWTDPYVEDQDRISTKVDRPGFRLRWGRILNTGLELTLTERDQKYTAENSGDWLIDEGRLDPADQPLLNREGESWQGQALYRIDTANKRHRFEPAIRYNKDDHDGAAIANQGPTLKLTYLYMTPRIVIDANAVLGSREADAVHPVYGQTLDWNRYGASLSAFVPIKLGNKNRWRAFVAVEYFRDDANINFFDTHVASILAGLVWRYNPP